jgi:Zn-dependent peptidase ImmA (M78 family)
MNPLRARYARIERVVSNLLNEYQVREVPVAIERIVKAHNIVLQSGDLGDVSGLLVRHGEKTVIGVNAGHPTTRRRFTIAHEFGHFILHAGMHSHVDKSYRVNFRSAASSAGTDVVEVEANFFAASILMPKQFLEKDEDVEGALDNDEGVQRLAAKYRVSGHAMSLRLANVFKTQTPF